MAADALRIPTDPTSTAVLADQGLRLGLVDPGDEAAFRPWLEAVARGFLEGTVTETVHAETRPDHLGHRTTGVWDASAAQPEVPVATISAWPNPLTVPGGSVDAWAISSVTVAPTHRRRGIARALLEAELRTAAAAGLPLAMLTVSEATIYGRYGFAPAAQAAHLTVTTRRAGWLGGGVPGRVQFVGREQLLADAPEVFERSRLRAPGGIALSGLLFTRLFGLPSDEADLRKRRFLRYDDADGAQQGFAVYTVTESETDFTANVLRIQHLAAATDDAYAALWRALLEHDLIGIVEAPLRSVDEPVRWLVADQRAIREQVGDHLWLRILDPVAALSARSYAGPARLVLEVADPLGLAEGRFRLEIDGDGRAEVGATEDPADAALDAAALAALHLGGVSAVTLARAGRLTEARPGAAAALDRAFRADVAPHLGVWF